jgi:NADPH2:quinone reductase
LPGARKPRAAARRIVDDQRRRHPGDLVHRLAQHGGTRRAQIRRDLSRTWRQLGNRTTAIQLAKALGAYVITTAGTAEKCEACRKLGADVAVNYKTEDFVAATKAATGGKGADVILDMVGGDYIARNYEAAAVEGRIVQIAFQGGPKSEVNFMRLMLKRLHHTGSTLRARSVADKGTIRDAVEKNALPLIVAGKVKPVIYQTFPLAEAAAAHALMETSAHIGKIVLTL